MGISKTEINLRRLIAAAPQQQNQAKLIHYVATLRELLEQLSEETTPEGLPRVSKAMVNDYSEKIESIASRLAAPVDLFVDTSTKETHREIEEEKVISPRGLRKRSVLDYLLGDGHGKMPDETANETAHYLLAWQEATAVASYLLKLNQELDDDVWTKLVCVCVTKMTPMVPSAVCAIIYEICKQKNLLRMSSSGEDRSRDNSGADSSPLVKLDAAAQSHIEKHRKLQEDLTDEMVSLAQQLKQSSLMMSQSVKNTEKILDSTEKAVERSLASTGHANVRAGQVFSESSKTSCFTWLLMFVMTCVFMMVVLLIRIT